MLRGNPHSHLYTFNTKIMRRKILYIVLLIAVLMNLALLITENENKPFAIVTTVGVLYVLVFKERD